MQLRWTHPLALTAYAALLTLVAWAAFQPPPPAAADPPPERPGRAMPHIDAVGSSRLAAERAEDAANTVSRSATRTMSTGSTLFEDMKPPPPPPEPEPVEPQTTTSGSTTSSAPVSGNRAIGRDLMLQRWGADQWPCLEQLWSHESGWSHTASNSSSGAYGIPQALPGSKMAAAGSDWQTNPATQIRWGLSYIGGRYGSPCNAWGFFQANNWY